MFKFILFVFIGAQIFTYSYKLSNSEKNSIYDEESETSVSFYFNPTSYNRMFKIENKSPYNLSMNVFSSKKNLQEITINSILLEKKDICIDLLYYQRSPRNGLKNTVIESGGIFYFDDIPIQSDRDSQFKIILELSVKNINGEIFIYSKEFDFIQSVEKSRYFPST